MNEHHEDQEQEEPMPTTIPGLESKKTELIAEKSENIARITELNTILKATRKNTPGNRAATEERSELIQDNTEIDTEIRQITDRIRILANDQFANARGAADLDLIVQLIAMRYGETEFASITERTLTAVDDLNTIRQTLRDLSQQPKSSTDH